ncbi:MAG: HAMP domain-containing protein [Desulfohalobiaceae bacterium]|nr:HAMP domain-containing protein [Desulfohalobiaceae bacterium]
MFLKTPAAWTKTIGFKLALWYSGFFVFSASLLFVLASIFLSQTLQRDDHKAITTQLQEFVGEYQKGGPSEVMAKVRNEFEESKKFRKRSHFFYRFASPDNKTTRIFFPRQWAEFDLGELEDTDPDTKPWIIVPPKSDEDDYALEVTSLRLSDGSWLQVGMSTESRQRVLSRFLESFMYVAVFLLLAGFFSGYFLSRRTLRPIRDLILTVQTIEKGKMDARVPLTKTDDELGELTRLFNGMLMRIETLIEGMKGALDDVAHELRTPMTRMHNIAETALRSGSGREHYKEALETFLEESNRILKMLNTLMDISEAETGVMPINLEEFRVKELIDPVVEVYSFIAEEKELFIRVEMEEDTVIKADFNRISQVLANLLDNAIKYTPDKGLPILVQAGISESATVISVTDQGQGVAEKELSKIWDRLYRGAKTSGDTTKGLGLGLSQVKAILQAHNGRVEVESQPGKGTTFRIYLPQ